MRSAVSPKEERNSKSKLNSDLYIYINIYMKSNSTHVNEMER